MVRRQVRQKRSETEDDVEGPKRVMKEKDEAVPGQRGPSGTEAGKGAEVGGRGDRACARAKEARVK